MLHIWAQRKLKLTRQCPFGSQPTLAGFVPPVPPPPQSVLSLKLTLKGTPFLSLPPGKESFLVPEWGSLGIFFILLLGDPPTPSAVLKAPSHWGRVQGASHQQDTCHLRRKDAPLPHRPPASLEGLALEAAAITSWALAAPSCARKKSPSPTAQHTQTFRSPNEPTSPTHSGGHGGKKLTFPNLHELKTGAPQSHR